MDKNNMGGEKRGGFRDQHTDPTRHAEMDKAVIDKENKEWQEKQDEQKQIDKHNEIA